MRLSQYWAWGAPLAAAFAVQAQPVIVQQPTNQSLIYGADTSLSVVASGTGSLTYTWQLNGTPFPFIKTVAGNGSTNYSGDNGQAINAGIWNPHGVAIDGSNNLIIADYFNNRIRKVDTNGVITTIAGTGTAGFSGDGGPATAAKIYYPFGVAVDAQNNLLLAVYGNNRVRKVSTSGIITTVVGTGAYGFGGDGGQATNAILYYPSGVATDATGDLWLIDAYNNRVRMANTNGLITTVAGNGLDGYSGDGGAATNARLAMANLSLGIAVDPAGNLFIADTDSDHVRKVDGNGIITTIAGNGIGGYSGDGGPATNASLYYPRAVAVDRIGNLFISDTSNDRIRRVDTNGMITTIAGNGVTGNGGDGSSALRASFKSLDGLAFDSAGDLYIADAGDNRIRKLSYSGLPTLLLTNITTQDVGDYQVIVTDSTGSATSSVATLTIMPSSPVFTIQPTNRTLVTRSNYSVPVFAAKAIGSPPISYQWQFSGTNLPAATNSFLVISNLQVPSRGYYQVLATNVYGVTSSSNVLLSIIDLPASLDATNLVWTTSSNAPWFPQTTYSYDGVAAAQDGASNNGQASMLQTTVTGPATISFWWRLQDYGPSYLASLGFSINGALQTNMTAAVPWQPMTYYLGTGAQTLQWIYTNINSANVFNGGWVDQVNVTPGPTPPALIAPPPDRTILAGSATTFSVTAVGTPPLNYQWQFNGTNIAGATKSAYSLANAQATNQGTYSVWITNAFGSTGTNAFLTVTPSAPVFTTQPTNFISVPRGNAVFFAKAAGSDPIAYQWQFSGTNLPGATSTTLFLSGLETSQAGNYQVVASNALGTSNSALAVLTLVPSMVVPWGNNVNGLFNIATGVTNAIGISAGYYHDLALTADGFPIGAGQNIFGETVPPAGLSNVVAVSAGDYFSVALKSDGTVTAWGEDPAIYPETRVPSNLTNVIAISAGYENTLALKRDRTVTAWGANYYGETNVPPGLSNVMAVSEGEVFSVALKNDGRVVAWGDNANGETNAASISNVVAIAAGVYATFVLRSDGTVSFFGSPFFITIPSGLSNVVAIAAGDGENAFALKRDGTVVGLTVFSTAPPTWLTNVVQISAGEFCNLAIVNDGAPFIEQNPWPQTVYSGSAASFNLVSVGVEPLSYQWSLNGTTLSSGTAQRLILTNVPLTSAGAYQCVVTNAFGSATSSLASLTVLRSVPRFDSLVYAPSNGLTLNLSGLSGHGSLIVYASTNLYNWTPICTNPPIVGTLQLIDASATNSQVRFYRVVEQ